MLKKTYISHGQGAIMVLHKDTATLIEFVNSHCPECGAEYFAVCNPEDKDDENSFPLICEKGHEYLSEIITTTYRTEHPWEFVCLHDTPKIKASKNIYDIADRFLQFFDSCANVRFATLKGRAHGIITEAMAHAICWWITRGDPQFKGRWSKTIFDSAVRALLRLLKVYHAMQERYAQSIDCGVVTSEYSQDCNENGPV